MPDIELSPEQIQAEAEALVAELQEAWAETAQEEGLDLKKPVSLDFTDRSDKENASAMLDAIIGQHAQAGVVIADEVRRKVLSDIKKKYKAPTGGKSS